MGAWAELLHGLLAAAAFRFLYERLPGSPLARGAAFGSLLWMFWIVSGTASALVWLNLPGSVAAANVAFGLPKCLAIGAGLAWIESRQSC